MEICKQGNPLQGEVLFIEGGVNTQARDFADVEVGSKIRVNYVSGTSCGTVTGIVTRMSDEMINIKNEKYNRTHCLSYRKIKSLVIIATSQ